jgi:hypothetical protein
MKQDLPVPSDARIIGRLKTNPHTADWALLLLVRLVRGIADPLAMYVVKTRLERGMTLPEIATLLGVSPEEALERWGHLDS